MPLYKDGMRLYLSSFRLGLYPAELVRLAGGRGARTLLVTNAGDPWPDTQQAATERELADLRGIGLEPETIDLRSYAGQPQELADTVRNSMLIWVRGGNTFALRAAMMQCGFDEVVVPAIRSGQVAYGGYSAGVCAITPSLRGVELVDETDENGPWNGIGLVDWCVAPHFRSNHPESELVERQVEYYAKNDVLYRTMRDGEVVVVEGGEEKLLGFSWPGA